MGNYIRMSKMTLEFPFCLNYPLEAHREYSITDSNQHHWIYRSLEMPIENDQHQTPTETDFPSFS